MSLKTVINSSYSSVVIGDYFLRGPSFTIGIVFVTNVLTGNGKDSLATNLLEPLKK